MENGSLWVVSEKGESWVNSKFNCVSDNHNSHVLCLIWYEWARQRQRQRRGEEKRREKSSLWFWTSFLMKKSITSVPNQQETEDYLYLFSLCQKAHFYSVFRGSRPREKTIRTRQSPERPAPATWLLSTGYAYSYAYAYRYAVCQCLYFFQLGLCSHYNVRISNLQFLFF